MLKLKLKTSVMTFILLSGFTGTEIALAQDDSLFATALQKYSKSYSQINEANEEFTKKITPHMTSFNIYRTWMDETSARLSQSEAKPLDIEQAFSQYRELLKNDKVCAGATLQTLQTDLHIALRLLKKDLVYLKLATDQSANGKSKADRELKKYMKTSFANAETAALKVEETFKSYSETLGSSNICQTLSSFDLILVAADTLSTTRNSPSPLRLADFLTNANQQKDLRSIKDESLDYLKAVETAFLRSLRSGDVSKSLHLLNRLEGNIAFGISASKKLSDLEKAEIESVSTLVKSNIRSVSESLEFPKFPGLVKMLNVKTRLVYEGLLKVERSVIRASDRELFTEAKAFCLTELRMNANDPLIYFVPKDLSEVLDLDAKLSEAMLKLQTLENSQELASR